MAAGDTAIWLHNKLGSIDDLWSGKTISSQLSVEKLQSIQLCFHALQPHVKVKLMLSFLYIHRRNVEEWKHEMEDILLMAIHDADQWVSMVAEMLRPLPEAGALSLELDDNNRTFVEVVTDLKKMVKKTNDVRMLPLECPFLNRNSLLSVAGQQPQTVKHFALKRKPKSAALRAELLQKSSENHRKHNNFPVKVRSFAKKMDDTTPIKGFPSRSPQSSGGFRTTPASRFERTNSTPLTPSALPPRPGSGRGKGVGIKMLDITEQPVGAKEAKRRRKVAELEQVEQQKKDKEAAAQIASQAPTPTYTPDYAAGLGTPAATKISAPAIGTSSVSISSATPTYVPAPSNRLPTTMGATTTTITASSLSVTTQQARDNLQLQLQQQLGQSQIRTQTLVTQPSNQGIRTALTMAPTTVPLQQLGAPQIFPQFVQPQQNPPAPAPKKGLSLTKDQMLEAQEMFKTSNKVTRPEKALILGFMAGARDNPCPKQGNVLSIRLSENRETVLQADGVQKVMLVETFFQMDYSTGLWKRIKKCKEAES